MTVAVLLPNFNNGPYLKECLESVFAQTYRDFKIYFIDDCSTDNSLEIVRSFPQDKIEIILKSVNSGIVDTMNEGLKRIETKYFIRMDGDDLIHPERFERLVNFMEKNPEIGVCSSAIRTFGISEDVWTYGTDTASNHAALIFGHAIGHASSIFRTAVLKENKIWYDNRFWRMEDYYLFYRLRSFTKTTSITDQLYFYRRESYNTNLEIEQKKNAEFRKFYQMILTELGVSPDEDSVSIHMQLAGRESLTFGFIDYKRHIRLIEEANRIKSQFPALALNSKLNKSLHSLACKLIDEKKVGFLGVGKMMFTYPSLLRYYFYRLRNPK